MKRVTLLSLVFWSVRPGVRSVGRVGFFEGA